MLEEWKLFRGRDFSFGLVTGVLLGAVASFLFVSVIFIKSFPCAINEDYADGYSASVVNDSQSSASEIEILVPSVSGILGASIGAIIAAFASSLVGRRGQEERDEYYWHRAGNIAQEISGFINDIDYETDLGDRSADGALYISKFIEDIREIKDGGLLNVFEGFLRDVGEIETDATPPELLRRLYDFKRFLKKYITDIDDFINFSSEIEYDGRELFVYRYGEDLAGGRIDESFYLSISNPTVNGVLANHKNLVSVVGSLASQGEY